MHNVKHFLGKIRNPNTQETEMNTKNETSLNFWRTLPGDVDKRLIVYDVNQTEYSSFIIFPPFIVMN